MENLLKMSNERLDELGALYLSLCREQNNDVLMRGITPITFERFLIDQRSAELIMDRILERHHRSPSQGA